MLKLTVSQDDSGDFASISEAVLAVPYELEAEISIGPGIYREKLVCEKRTLTLRGAGADATTLIFGDGGKLPHPDGRPTHTFRSYTAFFSGGSVTVEDLTIANDAGPGSAVGQAIAAYVDAEKAVFRRVRLLGNQDTLFCAPLPEAEREKDGFLGPRKFAPRRPSAQYYQSCEIAGDIDFIFGGADALFEQCILRTVDNHLPHSYITAPSGSANGLGFVFWDCDFVSDCPAGTVYLGRPWRPTGKTAVLDCRLGAHIAPEGFSGWNDRTDTCLARFTEAGSSGPGARQRPDWVAAPSAADAAARAFGEFRLGPCAEALPPLRSKTKEYKYEKTPQRRKMAHYRGGAGPDGLDAGQGERPRLPREDAGTGQQSGHLPESRCLKRATLSVIPKQ